MTQSKNGTDLKIRRAGNRITCKGPCNKTFEPTKENFYFRKSSKNGVSYPSPYCKSCERAEAAKRGERRYADPKTKKKILEQQAAYHQNHPECNANKAAQLKDRYANDPEFRERLKTRAATRRLVDPRAHREKKAAEYQRRKPKIHAKDKERRKNDPAYRLRGNLRTAVCGALKDAGGCKGGRSILRFLPYTMNELRIHLESQFESWMTWSNYGPATPERRTWHIDHIIPQSALIFDDFSHPNFIRCWGLANLRPLDSVDNIRKSNKIDSGFLEDCDLPGDSIDQ